MITLNDKDFSRIVAKAIDAIPEKYGSNIQNLAFVIEDYPTDEQRMKLGLHNQQTLFGLYEGIPLTRRASNYTYVLPDKITIFKKSVEQNSQNREELKRQVQHTVWHEVAHYFGLDHEQIFGLENKDT